MSINLPSPHPTPLDPSASAIDAGDVAFREDVLSALRLVESMVQPAAAAVYRVKGSQARLTCCGWIARPEFKGEPPPATLPVAELAYLAAQPMWQAGRRGACNLERWARANAFHSLASAPIGPQTGQVGLVCIAAAANSQDHLIPTAAQLLALGLDHAIHAQAQADINRTLTQETARQNQLRSVIEDNAHEGLLLLNPALRIHKINPAALQMLGYAAGEVFNQPLERVLVASQSIQPALTSALSGCAMHNLGDIQIYRRNGDKFLAKVRLYPIIQEGQVVQIVLYLQDLQEREQNRLQTQQLETRAILGEMTAVFAHEIRNPLNNISTSLQLLQMRAAPNDPNQAAMGRMLQDCDRMAELIKSALAFSKPVDYVMEPVDIAALLQRLLERLKARLLRDSVKVDFKADGLDLRVKGDSRALEQVFSNLITNAMNAMSENGGRLGVRVNQLFTEERIYVQVTLADTGRGIPSEIQAHIFEPFVTTEKSGTGLGLSTSRRIIIAHQGDLRLQQSFPGGSIFVVRLPAIT